MDNEKLHKLLKELPALPGVYQMLDSEAVVLYVGKARYLHKRVGSYFNRSSSGAKTKSLVSQIEDIKITVTQSETEALLLESNLIKRLKPKYNILLRDDKTYPYIVVTTEQEYPRIDSVRSKTKPKKGNYFGPYPSVGAVKETLLFLQKIFKLRTCRDSNFASRTRPCLQYQIKRCSGPCVGLIDKNDYQRAVKHALDFLRGKSLAIIESLERNMEEASEKLQFEQAAILRDQINSLRQVQQQQYVNIGELDADVLAVQVTPGLACIQKMSVRNGQVIANNSSFPKISRPSVAMENYTQEQLQSILLEAFIGQHYLLHPERIPKQIVSMIVLDNKMSIEQALTDVIGRRCQIITKPRGTKAKWVEMAQQNLAIAWNQMKKSQQKIHERYQALKQLLQLAYTPQRMECFDISHTMGEATVASCVVFGREGPLSQDYRRFNIKGITPGDDYAAIRQALLRRYQRLIKEQASLPDILFIDGGKGQVTQAREVFDELGIADIVLIGVAKGPERKAGWETLILSQQHKEIQLPADSPALHLIQHIRDEAHRFAITAHRNKRHKARFSSKLDDIEGVGAKRKQALLKRFGSVKAMTGVSVDEIAKVKGISPALAKKIKLSLSEKVD